LTIAGFVRTRLKAYHVPASSHASQSIVVFSFSVAPGQATTAKILLRGTQMKSPLPLHSLRSTIRLCFSLILVSSFATQMAHAASQSAEGDMQKVSHPDSVHALPRSTPLDPYCSGFRWHHDNFTKPCCRLFFSCQVFFFGSTAVC
jgi:hypothetical protein